MADEAPPATSPDPRPMVEAFQLGQRNLQELWSLVLTPVTLLELKKLSRQPLESFRMPDELWSHVVYDFGLAYRLRTLSRGHLLGAMAPLYLGWVGSRVLEVESGVPWVSRQGSWSAPLNKTSRTWCSAGAGRTVSTPRLCWGRTAFEELEERSMWNQVGHT